MMHYFTVSNAATVPQSAWIFIGMEPTVAAKLPPSGSLYGQRDSIWVRVEAGIRVQLVDIPFGVHWLKMDTEAEPAKPFEFMVHPSIDLAKTTPWFAYDWKQGEVPQYWAPGAPKPGPSFVRLLDYSDAHQTWHVRSRHADAKLTHDSWFTLGHMQSTIEFTTQTVYGTTANDGQLQEIGLAPLWMLSWYPMHRDFAPQAGLMASSAPNADGSHAFALATPMRLHRARRIENRGAILCGPDPARQQGRPMQGVWMGWREERSFLALGSVPVVPLRDDSAQRLQAYRHPFPGSYEQPRPLCQPPWSNTTGEQIGFGASALGRVFQEPQLLHDYLWQCQSYSQRPTANREPDGEPMLATAHPNAETMGMRPDLNWGANDRIGWPPPGQLVWINGYVCSDDEHRDDTTLAAVIALTRDPALLQIQRDHIELGKTEIRLKLGWIPAPRAIGRLLLAQSNALWLGIEDARPLIMRLLEQTGMNSAPGIVGQIGEAKYGWNNPDGTPVLGWQPWQQAIAAIGLLAAWRVTDHITAHTLALVAARAAVRDGFEPDLQHVYAVSVSGEKKLDPAANYWTVAGAYVLLALAEQDDPLRPKAQTIVQAFGAARDWMQSQWWAV